MDDGCPLCSDAVSSLILHPSSILLRCQPMPLTFIDIEKQKTWCIWILFIFLILMYAAVVASICMALFPLSFHQAQFWLIALISAIVISGIHFWVAGYGAVRRVIQILSAQPPDSKDEVHNVLLNVMKEVHIATGNKRKIQCAVIPSLSMNALAAADLKGDAVISITEGLLSRLTRPQLEAVIAHETHHILSGDCLETTIATSIFGSLSAIIEKTSQASRGRTFSSPGVLLGWALLKLSYLLNMLISREREYRADAAAVRMTRNPIALAESLHLLSRSWRGSGFIGSGFEMLCIVSPEINDLDETEGFWADLLSTHPPLKKRIDVLLKMVRVNISELDTRADRKTADDARPQVPEPKFFALTPQQQWQGPFTLSDLGVLPWLSPLTWISTGDQDPVDRAWKQPAINAIFISRLSQKNESASDLSCPVCRQPLLITAYEGTQVHQCHFCAGLLVETQKIMRILARTRPTSSDRVSALAKTVITENQKKLSKRKLSGSGTIQTSPYICPKCKNPMNRNFFNGAYLIEVDRCSLCGLTWFDHDELQMLQYLVEHRITPELGTQPEDRARPLRIIT